MATIDSELLNNIINKYDIQDIDRLKSSLEESMSRPEKIKFDFKRIDSLTKSLALDTRNSLMSLYEDSEANFKDYFESWEELKKSLSDVETKSTKKKIRASHDKDKIAEIDSLISGIKSQYDSLKNTIDSVKKIPDLDQEIDNEIFKLNIVDKKIKMLNASFNAIPKIKGRKMIPSSAYFSIKCKIKDYFDEYFSTLDNIHNKKEERSSLLVHINDGFEKFEDISKKLIDIENKVKEDRVKSNIKSTDIAGLALISKPLRLKIAASLMLPKRKSKKVENLLKKYGLETENIVHGFNHKYDKEVYNVYDEHYDLEENPEELFTMLDDMKVLDKEAKQRKIDAKKSEREERKQARQQRREESRNGGRTVNTNNLGITVDEIINQLENMEPKIPRVGYEAMRYFLGNSLSYYDANPDEINVLHDIIISYCNGEMSADSYVEYLDSIMEKSKDIDNNVEDYYEEFRNPNLDNDEYIDSDFDEDYDDEEFENYDVEVEPMNGIDVNNSVNDSNSASGEITEEPEEDISESRGENVTDSQIASDVVDEFIGKANVNRIVPDEEEVVSEEKGNSQSVENSVLRGQVYQPVSVNKQFAEILRRSVDNTLTEDDENNELYQYFKSMPADAQNNILDSALPGTYLDIISSIDIEDTEAVLYFSQLARKLNDDYQLNRAVYDYKVGRMKIPKLFNISDKFVDAKDNAVDTLKVLGSRACDNFASVKENVKSFFKKRKDAYKVALQTYKDQLSNSQDEKTEEERGETR